MEKECKDFGVRWLLSRALDNLRERVNLNPQISTQGIVKSRAVYDLANYSGFLCEN